MFIHDFSAIAVFFFLIVKTSRTISSPNLPSKDILGKTVAH